MKHAIDIMTMLNEKDVKVDYKKSMIGRILGVVCAGAELWLDDNGHAVGRG